MYTSSEKQSRYLSQAIQLEESTNPVIIRMTMITVSIAIMAFIIWSAVTQINEVARTPGEVVPQGHQQVVQHLEGGIVHKIFVREGQMVGKGQDLLELQEAGTTHDLERARIKQVSLAMQEERLRAFGEGRQPDFSTYESRYPELVKDQLQFFNTMMNARGEEQKIISEQINQKQQMIAALRSDLQTAQANYNIANDLYSRRKNLNSQGYASDMQLLETQQRVNVVRGEVSQIQSRMAAAQTEIREFQNRLHSLNAGQRDQANEKLDAVIAEAAQNAELIDKLQNRVTRLTMKSPVNGLIKGFTVNTVGAVVQPGQTLMEIVPMSERLVVQVKIPPQHIGHIKSGQDVQVKFSSFDFSRYGYIKGKLDQISA
ncbi:MAG TPA: HlyD family type I secretion periplasmic adaptor subunit, partial [Alphaproteobacteria bacterium]|nr:HlyD family type I secretion periplasmic adaptor subunit [Alphaproteobacteria bacterium]